MRLKLEKAKPLTSTEEKKHGKQGAFSNPNLKICPLLS